MEIDLTTLILELINFLILVWLLKHFLYQPILNVVNQRQAGINQQLQAAQSAREEAAKIQADYQHRLAEIEQERQRALHALDEELNTKRTKALQEIRHAASREEEKALQARQNKGQQWRREVEQQALLMASRFAAMLFRRIANEDLHRRLVSLALEELKTLPASHLQRIRQQENLQANISPIISSAFPLDESEKQQLQNCLHEQLHIRNPIQFNDDKDLIAGFRLAIGAWTLELNLANELKGFINCIHEPFARPIEQAAQG